jgi:hypothetical protein
MELLSRNKKYLFAFILISILIYFPIFFNGPVWDDTSFILTNPQVHKINFLTLFGQNLFNSGLFYRPLSAVYFAVVYALFKDHLFFYHFIQLMLHIACTSVLFLFFRSVFTRRISFSLALLFLVHPINVESVAYVGATQSELYFLPGITALLLSQKKRLSNIAVLSIGALLLLSILVKETGFLFLLLVIFYRYILKLGKIKHFLGLGVLIIFIYVCARFYLANLGHYIDTDIPIASLTLLERMYSIPAIFIYYLKTFIFPLHLSILQTWIVKPISFTSFILPLFLCIAFFSAIGFVAHRLTISLNPPKKKTHEIPQTFQQFIFFFIWYFLGMGILLQFVPLDMTVADRWFYFPIVGLLGMIGTSVQLVQSQYKRHKDAYDIAIIILLCLFSFRTFIRTFDWHTPLTLRADAKQNKENYLLNYDYAVELYYVGNFDEAIIYAKRSIATYPTLNNAYILGLLYFDLKQFDKAIEMHTYAITLYKPPPKNFPTNFVWFEDINLQRTYNYLASAYISTNKPNEAIKLIKNQALKKFPSDANLYIKLALAEEAINNHQEALKASSRAYELQPDTNSKYYYDQLRNTYPTTNPIEKRVDRYEL